MHVRAAYLLHSVSSLFFVSGQLRLTRNEYDVWRCCQRQVVDEDMVHAALSMYIWAATCNTENTVSAHSSSNHLSATRQTLCWTSSGCCWLLRDLYLYYSFCYSLGN